MVRAPVAASVLLCICVVGVGAAVVAGETLARDGPAMTAGDAGGDIVGLQETTDLYTSDDADGPQQVTDLIHTPDGGLIALVVGAADGGGFETTVLRLDEGGTVVRNESVRGRFEEVSRVDTDAYAAAGVRRNASTGVEDTVLLRIRADGRVQWAERYGGAESDVGLDAVSAPQGDTYLLSSTESFGRETSDLRVLRVDEEGTVRWEQFVEHETWVAFPKGERLSDGSLVATVRTKRSHDKSVDGKQNVSVARLTPDGEVVWRTVVVGRGEPLDKEEMFEVVPAHGDGVLIAGASNSGNDLGSHFDFWAASVSSDGDLRWQRQYETPVRSFAFTAVRSESGYVLAGLRSNDRDGGEQGAMRLRAIGENGTERYSVTFDRNETNLDYASGVDWLSDGRLVIGGTSVARTESGLSATALVTVVESTPPDLFPGPSTWETQHSRSERVVDASTATPTPSATPTATAADTPIPTETPTPASTTVTGTDSTDPTDGATGTSADGSGFGLALAVIALVVGAFAAGRGSRQT